MDPKTITEKLQTILPTVRQPGRYTGGELNQVVKDWSTTHLKTALFFPEVYDLGMSNLGLMILYQIINEQSEYLAERVFLPWTDMEAALREGEIPLFSLETRHKLQDFDLIGVSLPYESLYTNFLNGLNLGRIPLRTKNRSSDDPLILGGGHGVFNPEPVAPFLDAVVIGEGEEVILEILDTLTYFQPEQQTHQQRLELLAGIEGVYIPDFYQPRYYSNGSIQDYQRVNSRAPETIRKRILGALPKAPTRLIVPYIDTVHNRAPIEIMRGCTRGCRFCHAGMINRPVRERSVEEVLETMEEIIPSTGYSEIGLLSLSSSDYSQIIELIEKVNQRFSGSGISVSLPSLRIESVSVDLMDALADQRRSGFTLAPEAASNRMRRIINKPITDQQLLDTAREIYRRGWHTIKLYFMIGLPAETKEDVLAIASLSRRVLAVGEQEIGSRAQVHISVSSFVPKPFTPFQWAAVDKPEQIHQKIKMLQKEIRGRGLKLNWNDPENTIFESWLARGDRRLADVIETAWENGAKFDAWREHFNFHVWLQAFQKNNLDDTFYSHRVRHEDEVFPWDHLNAGIRKSFLWQDYQWSLEGKTRPDCRDGCYACGILPSYNQLRQANPGPLWLCPEIT